MRNNDVVGYLTTLPVHFWDGLSEWPAYWLKGLMVLPEFRNGPVGHALLKAAARHLQRSGGLAVALPARRLFVALGYADLGEMMNLVRPIASARILRQLATAPESPTGVPRWVARLLFLGRLPGVPSLLGGAVGGLLWAIRRTTTRRLSAITVTTGEPPEIRELDGLWKMFRASIASGVVRDGAYLLERYPTTAGSPYSWLVARRDGALAGVAVVRAPGGEPHPRLQGLRVGTLVDAMDDPAEPGALPALIAGAEREGRRLQADALLTSASAPRLQRNFRRQGYFPMGGNVHLLFRNAAPDGEFAADLGSWWLTRGDGRADDAL